MEDRLLLRSDCEESGPHYGMGLIVSLHQLHSKSSMKTAAALVLTALAQLRCQHNQTQISLITQASIQTQCHTHTHPFSSFSCITAAFFAKPFSMSHLSAFIQRVSITQ